MAAPTSYTNVTLAGFMHDQLGNVAQVLGFHNPGSYLEAVNEVMITIGVTDVQLEDEIDLIRLRTLARREAWRMVVHATGAAYNFSVAGDSYNRAELHRFALEMYTLYTIEALSFDPTYAMDVVPVDHIHDPYLLVEDELRVS